MADHPGRNPASGRRSRSITQRLRFAGGLVMGLFASLFVHAQVNVTTALNDIGRTGQNLNETILTRSNVNATQFGKLFAQPVDGEIYAQPLYLSNLTINGTTHNVVFVATEHDSVYAFDADNTSGTNSSPLWMASMLTAAHGAAAGATTEPGNGDLNPEIGITGTPVIDPSSGTLYVVSKSVEGGSSIERLHALDVKTGAEKFGGPVTITANVPGSGSGSVSGSVPFQPHYENQRTGLLLLNGIVYVATASHVDQSPWHGWVLAYNAATLAQTGVFLTTPNGNGGGIWMIGTGIAADRLDPTGHPYGRMFPPTGNGHFAASPPYDNTMDYGDSILNLDLTNGVPTIVDDFTPSDQAHYDDQDIDVGSGGVMLLPPQSGTHPNLLVQTGKSGWLYLIDRDNLGGYHTTDQVLQSSNSAVTPLWSSPAYWNGTVYYAGQRDQLKAFPLVNGLLTLTSPVQSTETYEWPGATPAISANGTTQGIVWTIDSGAYAIDGAAILRAHDAGNVATTLYTSTTNSTRDGAGPAVKFAVPTVANGKVYVGTGNQLDVYGLLSGATQTAVPSFSPGSGTYAASLSVTITDATPNSTIYYTTDGSPATISSNVYAGPIAITSSPTTINAIATSAGLLASSQASATYTVNLPAAATPTFSPAAGTYSTTQSVVVSDTTAGATIYYTTDGTTPTTASTVYTGAITVSSTRTIKAIATASGYAASAVGTATYTISLPQAATPTFSPAAGTYATTQSVTLSDTTSGATIYYTTDGSSPTTASPVYSGPISVSTTQTIRAIATASGYSTSAVASASYTIGNTTAPVVNYPNGFTSSTGLSFNGGSSVSGGALMVTDGGYYEARSAWYSTQVNVQTFTTDFTFQIPVSDADGFTFAIQNVGLTALGGAGSDLGYGGITSSVAIKFDLHDGQGEGTNSTGFYTNGATPTIPALNLTASGVNLHSGNTMSAHLVYDGTTLTLTITDLTTAATFTASTAINIPATVGGNTAYIGFTGGTGGLAATQKILSWTYSNTASSTPTAATPTFSPAAGTYTTTQTVTLSDSTSGATIYYTTNGTTPTTASTVYTAPISVSATQTIKAIAAASGYTTSAVASATYTISTTPTAATPTFSPAAGTYTSAQSVTISDATSGATIYYTTDGSTPTTASAVYSAPISVSATQTIKAIAAAGGYTTSAVATAAYTISSGSGPVINYPSGFTSSSGLSLNGGASVSGAALMVTDGGFYEMRSAWNSTQVNVQAFTTDFTFQIPVANADGFTFTIQNKGATAVGGAGGDLGYAGITSSVAVKFDLFDGGTGEGPNSTGFYTNGAVPNMPALSLTASGVNLHSGNTMSAHLVYDGTTLTLTITDLVTSASFTASTTINIPTIVGGNTAYVGFTGGTGGLAATQKILTWTYSNSASSTPTAATPTFSPAAGTYTSAQSVTLSDTTSGATIYYTTDGTTPTTASAVYSAPIAVSATQTIKAIAAASGYTTSAVASATYTINITQPTAATPTFSPVAGTYTAAQGVTLSDTTAGATIYYTTNGTTPTTASTVYTGPISVGATQTIKAIAAASGYTTSAVASATYTINITLPTAATPTFSPAAGTYTAAQSVTISDTTAGATIYYTTNGTTATTASTVYTGPISVGATQTIKAIAAASGYTTSAVASATYTINITLPTAATPTFTPATGTYTATQSVTISDTTAGATIYYTTNGATPTTASTVYTAPISVTATQTIKAIAAASGYTTSAVASATYTISLPKAATPTFTPAAGTYTATQNVTINDTTAGATIYYTTNGATPTTSSSVYTTPIAVSATQTLKAIATASGYSTSSVGTAAYTITLPAAATPTFSPAAGTYTTTQNVALSDATSGATIYYTTDGTTPTAASTVYSAPISVSATQTIKAIATASGYSTSAVGSASYTINNGSTPAVNYPSGFTSSSGLSLNGGAAVSGTALMVTDGGYYEMHSAWNSTQVNVQAFTTDFTFQIPVSDADGFTFTIQNKGATAVGGAGGDLGYAGITSSVAVKFDLFDGGTGEGPNSTGFYTNGAVPSMPALSLTASGVNLHSGNTMSAHLVYDGTTLTLTITDLVTSASFTTSTTINIPAVVGGNTAYVGFTGGTGGLAATQKILTWTYSNSTSSTPTAATPTFSPAAGTYTSTQSVTLSDTTTGATIYYTTNGTTPTTASTVYTAPISVSSTQTIKAIAAASGYTTSAVASAAYTINVTQPTAATPTFSPAAGTYTTTQNVTISDTTAGATIYYTTNGSTPTTASTVYTAPISVSATQTIKAIAAASGYTTSAVGSAAYTINSGSTSAVNFPSGFTSTTGLSFNGFNGGATLSGTALLVTDGGFYESHSIWYSTPVNVQNFTTDFTFQLTAADADGFTFAIQNVGTTAIGGAGSDLGYGGIASSLAVKFDVHDGAGEGINSTGFYTSGATPTVPAQDLTASGVNLHSGNIMSAHLVYDGVTLTLTITDTVTNATFTTSSAINIPTTVGGNTAYIGFTGGTGGLTATQKVLTWTHTVH